MVQLLHNRRVATTRRSIGKNVSLGQLYSNMQEAYHQMHMPLIYQDQSAEVNLLNFLVKENKIIAHSWFTIDGYL